MSTRYTYCREHELVFSKLRLHCITHNLWFTVFKFAGVLCAPVLLPFGLSVCYTGYTPLNVTFHFIFSHWLNHIHTDSDTAFLFSDDCLSFLVIITNLPEALLHVVIAACVELLSEYRPLYNTDV